ncbi:MAG: hypothetical protein L7S46_05010, partial [Candidatus Poseidoniaceae archaeon]|nr:hypothetical protein [Candidatus Poseidoniaceae archaeon]
LLQLIGDQWRQMQRDQKEANAERVAKGPQTGDRRARSQRKGRAGAKPQRTNQKKRSGFKKKR